ncbi:hypothetical protein [Sorangium sp. So ce1000]|uniref:hypothetical protein n=1 Tax=Sorangium sp. So ce1000 TaxID=3133325 RepID=UPI003F63CA81
MATERTLPTTRPTEPNDTPSTTGRVYGEALNRDGTMTAEVARYVHGHLRSERLSASDRDDVLADLSVKLWKKRHTPIRSPEVKITTVVIEELKGLLHGRRRSQQRRDLREAEYEQAHTESEGIRMRASEAMVEAHGSAPEAPKVLRKRGYRKDAARDSVWDGFIDSPDVRTLPKYYRALSLMRQPTAPSTMLDGEGFRPTRLAIKENARSAYATREDDSRALGRTTHYIRPLKILSAAPSEHGCVGSEKPFPRGRSTSVHRSKITTPRRSHACLTTG